MADSGQDRTEKATPRRQQKARNDGQVIKSPELQAALGILSSVIALKLLGPRMQDMLVSKFVWSFEHLGDTQVNEESLAAMALSWSGWAAWFLLPFAVPLSILAMAGTVWMQGGFVFSGKGLSPSLARLNPITGAKRLFSGQIFFNLGRDVLKMIVVGLIIWAGVREAIVMVMAQADSALAATISMVSGATTNLMLRAAFILLLVGLADYTYQRRKYYNDIKMSKKDVKDEMKESEGDPLIKSRLRSQQRDLVRGQMMLAVPTADVILTNPTHVAVALKYNPDSMDAPRVVAKGKRLLAQRIKEIGRQHGIPIIEDKPLARSLYKMAPVGAEIPAELYRAVAEVISYVYSKKGKGLRPEDLKS